MGAAVLCCWCCRANSQLRQTQERNIELEKLLAASRAEIADLTVSTAQQLYCHVQAICRDACKYVCCM